MNHIHIRVIKERDEMIENIWRGFVEWVTKEFIGMPSKERTLLEAVEYGQDNSLLAHAIRCESVHFLSSAFLGCLVFSLILIILSEKKSEWSEVFIFRSSLLFGLSASATIHIIIDGFTNIA